MDANCPICGNPVCRHEGRAGRPPIYCGKRCRKRAELHERARLYRLGRAVEAAIKDSL
jgi:endogenous inhibitor of DNA gyrase (YacG/DUF329 family)